MAGSERPKACDALAVEGSKRALEARPLGRIEFQQRLEHEAPMLDLRVRNLQVRGVDARPLHHQDVDVERAGRMARCIGVTPELELDPLGDREQPARIEIALDLDARVQEVVLADGAALRLGFVHVRPRGDVHALALERVAPGAQVRDSVAEVRAEAQPGLQSPRSFQTSTVTSSTGSGIGGSGLVARTVTASAS